MLEDEIETLIQWGHLFKYKKCQNKQDDWEKEGGKGHDHSPIASQLEGKQI